MTASNLAIDPVRGSSLSSLDDIPNSMEFNLFKPLDGLINGGVGVGHSARLPTCCPLTREPLRTPTSSFSCSKH